MENGVPKGVKKHLETRIQWQKLKFLASVDFRLLPRPLGRGGFVSFGILPARRYCEIGGGILEKGHPKARNTPGNAETRAVAKIPSFRLLPRASVCFRGRAFAAVSLVSD